jgi:hypothetical protein
MNGLHTIRIRMASRIGHSLYWNCLLKHVIEGKIEGRIQVMGKEEEDLRSYWITLRKLEATGK